MPDPDQTIQFEADRGDARLRLDQILVRRVTDVSRLSRNVARRWIESGAVTVDGRPAERAATRVREGATIAVALPATAARRARPAAEPAELSVLHEDDSMLVLDKPAGTVVHPSYKRTAGTLLNAVLWRLRDRGGVRPGILTRLDKDTSGIVVVALTGAAHAQLQRDAAAGRVVKEYLAIVSGRPQPPRGRIVVPLGRDPHDRRRIVPAAEGAPSETRYEVAATIPEGRTLVRCELVTGRTHQIRVHLASRGWPVVGDRVYGAPDDVISRQALHAWRITLPHPQSGETLTLVAPVPDDMRAVIAGAAR